MKKSIVFKLYRETEIPQELINDAPNSGPFDDYASDITQEYAIDVSLNDSIEYLRRFGAWNDSELQDLESNIARILWISILDCKENDTNIFYMGE